jgi:hypothetical protein
VLRPREDGCWLRMAARPTRATRRAASALSGPSAGRGVAIAMFGPTGLDMLICRIACVACARAYAQLCITLHDSCGALRRSGNCCARFSSGHIEPDRRIFAFDRRTKALLRCTQIILICARRLRERCAAKLSRQAECGGLQRRDRRLAHRCAAKAGPYGHQDIRCAGMVCIKLPATCKKPTQLSMRLYQFRSVELSMQPLECIECQFGI